MSVVRFKFRCNILISGKIIKEMPGSVASGTPYRICHKVGVQNIRTVQFVQLTAKQQHDCSLFRVTEEWAVLLSSVWRLQQNIVCVVCVCGVWCVCGVSVWCVCVCV